MTRGGMDNTWVGMEFSEEHYAALGKMLVAFQRLEVVVSSYDAASHLRYLRHVVVNPEARANQLAQRLPTQERVAGPSA